MTDDAGARATIDRGDRSGIDWLDVHARLQRTRLALESGGTPPPDEIERILRERARTLARPRAEATASEDALEVLVFSAAGERFAVGTQHVLEAVALRELTPVPCTPPVVLGVVNHRGRILAVLDLRRLFDLPGQEVTERSRIVLVQVAGSAFGILAEAVVGIARIGARELGPTPVASGGRRPNGIRGVTADLVAVLELEALVQDPRIVVDEEVG